jgi:hypothetical protein
MSETSTGQHALGKVWKEPSIFLAHPRAIAAFGRECTRRGVPPAIVTLFGSPFLTWRGVPLIPTDKIHVDGKAKPAAPGGKTSMLLLRVGEKKQGVIGLFQPGLPGEQTPGLSVRFMGISRRAIGSYLISLYCSAAALTDDAIASLEGVEVDNYHDLLLYATEALKRIPGLRLIGNAAEKASVLSFVLDGFRTDNVGAALNLEGIAVRSGHHCAQPILRRFGVESTVRPSLALYNTCEEVDALIAAIWNLKSGRRVSVG